MTPTGMVCRIHPLDERSGTTGSDESSRTLHRGWEEGETGGRSETLGVDTGRSGRHELYRDGSRDGCLDGCRKVESTPVTYFGFLHQERWTNTSRVLSNYGSPGLRASGNRHPVDLGTLQPSGTRDAETGAKGLE